jgi:hypothetical protein
MDDVNAVGIGGRRLALVAELAELELELHG